METPVSFVKKFAQVVLDSFAECPDFGSHAADVPTVELCKQLVDEQDELKLRAFFAVSHKMIQHFNERYLIEDELEQYLTKTPIASGKVN